MHVTSFKQFYLEEKKKARAMRGKKGKKAKKSFSAKKRAKKNAPPIGKGANPKRTVKPVSKDAAKLNDVICKIMYIDWDTKKSFNRVVIAKEHFAGVSSEKVKSLVQSKLKEIEKENPDQAENGWWKITNVTDDKQFITVKIDFIKKEAKKEKE